MTITMKIFFLIFLTLPFLSACNSYQSQSGVQTLGSQSDYSDVDIPDNFSEEDETNTATDQPNTDQLVLNLI